MVVQPGVEYGDDHIFDYDRAAAAELSRFITTQPGLVYEAHSTDYQTPAALRALVEDHFAILKVGPALTFAYREAVFALELIEREWLAGRPGITLSGVRSALDAITAQGEITLDNDYVFVLIGGEPPFPFLRSIGVLFGNEAGNDPATAARSV